MAVSPFIRLASIRSNPLGDRTASHTGIALVAILAPLQGLRDSPKQCTKEFNGNAPTVACGF